MSYNDHNGSTEAPSRTSVAAMTAATVLVGTGTFWLPTAGPVFDGRHLVGFLLGLVAMVTLACQTIDRYGRRLLARITARLRADLAAANTGTWTDSQGRTLTVAYDLERGWFRVTGRVAAGWELEGEVWPDRSTLGAVLTEAERDGYEPADDEGTRSIRARLLVEGAPHGRVSAAG